MKALKSKVLHCTLYIIPVHVSEEAIIDRDVLIPPQLHLMPETGNTKIINGEEEYATCQMDDTCTGSEGEECLVGSPPVLLVSRPTLPGMCSNQTP